MYLSDLFSQTDSKEEVVKLCIDSNEVIKNSVFFAIDGYTRNGNDYIEDAVQKGAVAIVTEHDIKEDFGVQIIKVNDVRETMALTAAKFYNNPADKLKIVFVTGTNGKTSTTFLIESILRCAGKKTGIIGTLGARWNDNIIDTEHTTPDPIVLHELLSRMLKDGIEYVIIEASAHAIYLKKLAGIRAIVGVLTNITQDHLDFFKTMENYAKVKIDFINSNACYYSVINADNIKYEFKKPSLTYGIYSPSDVFALDVQEGREHNFVINLADEIYTINTRLEGLFNVYNILAAATCAHILGIKKEDIVKGVWALDKIDGRYNVIDTANGKIIIDFAHTPDGLCNLLKAAREFKPHELICVFGCGGNRDALKRPIMGKIAEELSDVVVLTSDNPRYENPQEIIKEIKNGMCGDKVCFEIPDRESAIKFAVGLMVNNDILVIAGKGAENYIETNGVKRAYSDKDAVYEILGAN